MSSTKGTKTFTPTFAQVYRPAPNPAVEMAKRLAVGDPPTNWQLHNVLSETIRGINREERRLRPRMTREDKIVIDDVKDILRSAQVIIDEKNRDEQLQKLLIHGIEAGKQSRIAPVSPFASLLGLAKGSSTGRFRTETSRLLVTLRRALWLLVQHPEFQKNFKEFCLLLSDIVFYDQTTGELRPHAAPLKKAMEGRKGLRTGALETISAVKSSGMAYGSKMMRSGKKFFSPTTALGAAMGMETDTSEHFLGRTRTRRGGRRMYRARAAPYVEVPYAEYEQYPLTTDITGGRYYAERPSSFATGRSSGTWVNPNAPPAPPLPAWGPESFRSSPLPELIREGPAAHWKRQHGRWRANRRAQRGSGAYDYVGAPTVVRGAEDIGESFGSGGYYEYYPDQRTGEFLETETFEEYDTLPYEKSWTEYDEGLTYEEYEGGEGGKFISSKVEELTYRLREMIKTVGQMEDYRIIVDAIFSMIDALGGIASSVTGTVKPANRRVEFHLYEARQAARSLVESFTGMSLEPLIGYIGQIRESMSSDIESRMFFNDLKRFIKDSLENPGKLDDPAHLEFAKELVMRGMNLTKSGRYRKPMFKAIKEAGILFAKLASDSTLRGFYMKVDKLVRDLTLDEYGRVRPNTHAISLLKEMAIPILLRQLQYIPLPRVEGTSPEMDYWADNMVLLGHEITPDKVKFEIKTEKNFNVNALSSETNATTIKVTISDINVYVQNIHFWFNRKVFPKLTDEGIAHADVLGMGKVIKIWLINDNKFAQPFNFRLLKTSVKFKKIRFKVDQSLKHKGLINFGSSLMGGRIRKTANSRIAEALLDGVVKINALLNTTIGAVIPNINLKQKTQGLLSMLVPIPREEDLKKPRGAEYGSYEYCDTFGYEE